MLLVPNGAGWFLTATHINDRGQIVGHDFGRVFLWENCAVRDLTAESGEADPGVQRPDRHRGRHHSRSVGIDRPAPRYYFYDRGRVRRVGDLLPSGTPWTVNGAYDLILPHAVAFVPAFAFRSWRRLTTIATNQTVVRARATQVAAPT